MYATLSVFFKLFITSVPIMLLFMSPLPFFLISFSILSAILFIFSEVTGLFSHAFVIPDKIFSLLKVSILPSFFIILGYVASINS